MSDRSFSAKIFPGAQFLFLVVLLISVLVLRRKIRRAGEERPIDPTKIYVPPVAAKAERFVPPKGEAEPPAPEAPEAPKAALSSALPTWAPSTPPHEILGVPAGADADTVEAAYRALLKKYHPDRFASWGKGYQTRAHHVIILIQEARDKLLGKRP